MNKNALRFLLPTAVILSLTLTTGVGRAFAEAASAGFGVTQCSIFLSELRDPRTRLDADIDYFIYAQGYMSALNLVAQLNNYPVTDSLKTPLADPVTDSLKTPLTGKGIILGRKILDAQKAFLVSWCRQNPGRNYESATLALYTLMRERQGLPQLLPPPRASTPSEMHQ
jgi:hypothetical protein